MFYSLDLRFFIDHIVKTALKRIDTAQLELNEFLNSHVFGNYGPSPLHQLRKTLGAPADADASLSSLQSKFIPTGFTGPALPKKESEANILPLSSNPKPHLVLRLGLLRRFDEQQNHQFPNQHPQCNTLQF